MHFRSCMLLYDYTLHMLRSGSIVGRPKAMVGVVFKPESNFCSLDYKHCSLWLSALIALPDTLDPISLISLSALLFKADEDRIDFPRNKNTPSSERDHFWLSNPDFGFWCDISISWDFVCLVSLNSLSYRAKVLDSHSSLIIDQL